MPKKPKTSTVDAALRRRAEAQFRKQRTQQGSVAGAPESAADTQRLLHELQVHQIELEMQNAELRAARDEAEALSERYTDLYDLAPVGYCTVSEKGLIRDANLTAARLLGVARGALAGQPITRFILPEDQGVYARHREQVCQSHATVSPQVCELRMVRKSKAVCWVRLEATAAKAADGALVSRVVLSDITKRKQAEQEVQETNERLRFETLLADLSARFLSVPADQVDALIEDAQCRVCECLGLGAVGLWQREADDPNTMVLTHHHLPPGSPPVPEQMKASEYFPWSLREMMAGRCILVSSLDNVPDGAERDLVAWRQFGLKNVATFPLSAGGKAAFGAISFHDVVTSRTWSEPLVKRLELVAQVFANAIVRNRAERALCESEERLSMALDAAGAGVWSLDVPSGRAWVSAHQRELFRFPADEHLTYDSFLHVVHPDDRESVRTAVENALRTKTPLRVDYRIARSDGSVCWIAARGRPRINANGDPDRLTGIAVDITERKQREETLRSSAARVASAVDIAGLGFYELGENARVTFMDDRIRTLFGIPPEEAPHASDYWVAHIHPEDLPRVLQMSRETMEGGASEADAEYQYVHPSRGRLWLHHLARVQARNAAGRVIRLLGVIQDITERKRAELALKESEWWLSHTQHIAHVGSWDWDIGTNRLKWSDETARIFGLAPDRLELTRDAYLERIHLEDRDAVAEAVCQALDEPGRQYSVQHRIVRPDGSERIVHERGEVVCSREGKPVRMIGSIHDVTEYTLVEAESRQLRTQLAHLDRIATASVLTAALAHEINQPLAAILSNAQAGLRLLTCGHADLDEIRDVLHDIVHDDKRAGEVIRRLRTMLKREGPQLEEFDLNEAVREVAGLLHSEVIIRKVSLVIDPAPDPPVIWADPVQVQQIILNLLMNGLDAVQDAPRNKRRIVVSTRADAGGRVLLTVRDSGPGIPPDRLEDIFDPFYSTKKSGMGLGLAICRSIARVYGGNLVAGNAPGGGALFVLSLSQSAPEPHQPSR